MKRKRVTLHFVVWLGRQNIWLDSHQRTIQFEQMRDMKNLERLQRSHYNDECFSEPVQSGKRNDCQSGMALVISQNEMIPSAL